jgi:uncharacterized protein (DUF2147 family)
LTSANLFAQSGNTEADQILGVWLTGNEKAKVQVYKCGDKYCGKIVWLKEPFYEDGKAKHDKNNPDEKLQSRPTMGMNLLTDFEYDDDLEWEDGEIYDPEEGKTYSCVINMDEDDKKILNVRGYIGFSFIGRTDSWTRSEVN